MHMPSDLMSDERTVYGTQKNSCRHERVAEIDKSWKSCTCVSADYLKKKKKKEKKKT